MTTNEIIAGVRKKILETTEDVIDDPTLLMYLNDVNQDMRIRIFPNETIKTATLPVVNGIATLPTDFGTLYGDAYIDAYNIFPEVPINDFMRDPVRNAVTVENGTLKVNPISTATITIKYYPTFETLSDMVDPSLPVYFHSLYYYGTLASALEDLQDEELSKYYDDKYEAKLKLKMDAYSNYQEGNQRGGEMFNGIGIITDSGPSRDPNHW